MFEILVGHVILLYFLRNFREKVHVLFALYTFDALGMVLRVSVLNSKRWRPRDNGVSL